LLAASYSFDWISQHFCCGDWIIDLSVLLISLFEFDSVLYDALKNKGFCSFRFHRMLMTFCGEQLKKNENTSIKNTRMCCARVPSPGRLTKADVRESSKTKLCSFTNQILNKSPSTLSSRQTRKVNLSQDNTSKPIFANPIIEEIEIKM